MRSWRPITAVFLQALCLAGIGAPALHSRAQGPMRTRWLAPWSRDTVYVSQHLREAELQVSVAGSVDELNGLRLYAEVVGDTAGVFWSQLRQQRYRPVEPENSLPFDCTRMADGEHVVRLILFERESQRVLGETRTTVHKLPAAPVEVCPARNGVVLVNGDPTFPVAIATSLLGSDDMARFAASGLRLAVDTGSPEPERTEHLLASAAASGVRLMAPFPSTRLTADDGEAAEAFRAVYRSTASLLGWHPGTPGTPLSAPAFKRFVDCSPYRPMLSRLKPSSVADARADIVAVVPRLPRRRADLHGDSLAQWAEAIQGRAARGLPTWAVIPLRLVWDGNGPDPMRTMAWLAVARGAHGIVFDDEGHEALLGPDHGCWTRVARVSSEFHLACQTLARGAERPLDVSGTQALAVSARYHNFRWLVVAVNTTPKRVAATLSLPDMAAGTALRVLSEARTIVTAPSGEAPRHAEFADGFEPYQAHVYTTLRTDGP